MLKLLNPALSGNAYAVEIDLALPRVLAMVNTDALSPLRGLGDRQFWGWKLIDFANGTMQGHVNGLSALLSTDAFGPSVSTTVLSRSIELMLDATAELMRPDGSYEEALPYEQSFCVTALVLYDYLSAVDRLGGGLAADAARMAPAARFLTRRDETHGFISNHLATAAAALFRWDRLVGDGAARRKAELLLSRIVERQSPEGWYEEYGGADPGYQTLCMSHLAEIALTLDAPGLWKSLERGVNFLSHFAHPDGSFGGIYGSRSTRVYYPTAMELLADRLPSAKALADWMQGAIGRHGPVTLAAIDAPNLLPVFNNYCQALLVNAKDSPLAAASPAPHGRQWMPEAQLLTDVGPRHHTVVSTRKSVVCHWRDGELRVENTGVVVRSVKGQVLTSQADPKAVSTIDGDAIVIDGRLIVRAMPQPNPYNFVILRLMSLTIMRLPPLGALVKKAISALFLRAGRGGLGRFRRQIRLGPDLTITDSCEPPELAIETPNGAFSVVHMASSGYWQRSDTQERRP